MIYNHSSMRVPGEPRMFLMKRHELLYTEVTASNLVKVTMDEDLDEKAGVNRPGFTLHGGVLSARPDVNCAVHVHTNNGMAISGLKHGLRMVSQQAVRFYKRIGYHGYEGITEDFDERARINRDLGKNRAMIMHNHGLLTVGKTAREAFTLMKALIDAADIQLTLEATGSELIEIPPERSAPRPPSNTSTTISAAAPPTGRPICACSTRSMRATATDVRRRKQQRHEAEAASPQLRHQDVGALDKFYRDVLDMQAIPGMGRTRIKDQGYPGDVAFITDGDLQMHIAEKDMDIGFRTGKAVNPVDRGHIAFRTDDLAAFKKRPRREGHQICRLWRLGDDRLDADFFLRPRRQRRRGSRSGAGGGALAHSSIGRYELTLCKTGMVAGHTTRSQHKHGDAGQAAD